MNIGIRRGRAFLAASLSLAAIFATAGTPVPLYQTYRVENGVTTGQLAVVAVSYFIAVAVALLFFGRLSNHVGRRPLSIAALVFAIAGCAVLLHVDSAIPLTIGRALQGLGGGLASSAVSAYIIDAAPERPSWLGPVVTGTAPMLGLPVGALVAGALVEYAPMPRTLVFFVMIAILLLCAALVLRAPETTRRSPGALGSIRPTFALPATTRRLLPVGVAVLVGTWAVGAFYQAFGPAVAADQLGSDNRFVGAMVFASIMILNPVGGFLTGRFSVATTQRLGMGVFVVMIGGVVLALATGAIAAFLVCSAIAGAAWGAAFSGTMRGLLHGASASERAGILSTIYLISYSVVAASGLGAGALTSTLTLLQIAEIIVAITALAGIVVLIAARNPAAGARDEGAYDAAWSSEMGLDE